MASFELSILQSAIIFAVICAGNAIPSSPGGLGVYEGAVVLALSWYGISDTEALSFALVMRLITFIPVTVSALIIGRKAF